jgi:hypothetical protein
MTATLTKHIASGSRGQVGLTWSLGAGHDDPDGATANHQEHSDLRIIEVRPFADGWTVRCQEIDNDLVFRSGRAAEQAALRLAARLAKAGTPSEIRIHLKDGALGGRFFSPAPGDVAANVPRLGAQRIATSGRHTPRTQWDPGVLRMPAANLAALGLDQE